MQINARYIFQSQIQYGNSIITLMEIIKFRTVVTSGDEKMRLRKDAKGDTF